MRRLLAAAALVVGLTACGGDSSLVRDDAAPETSASDPALDPETDPGTPAGASEPVETFEGDPASAFCEASREAAARPVLDPFAPGIDPREVELRFRALVQRFDGFADLAPEPLEEDLDALTETFGRFRDLLESADYDFAVLAEDEVDLTVFDDDRLAVVASRLAAYQRQVCDVG